MAKISPFWPSTKMTLDLLASARAANEEIPEGLVEAVERLLPIINNEDVNLPPSAEVIQGVLDVLTTISWSAACNKGNVPAWVDGIRFMFEDPIPEVMAHRSDISSDESVALLLLPARQFAERVRRQTIAIDPNTLDDDASTALRQFIKAVDALPFQGLAGESLLTSTRQLLFEFENRDCGTEDGALLAELEAAVNVIDLRAQNAKAHAIACQSSPIRAAAAEAMAQLDKAQADGCGMLKPIAQGLEAMRPIIAAEDPEKLAGTELLNAVHRFLTIVRYFNAYFNGDYIWGFDECGNLKEAIDAEMERRRDAHSEPIGVLFGAANQFGANLNAPVGLDIDLSEASDEERQAVYDFFYALEGLRFQGLVPADVRAASERVLRSFPERDLDTERGSSLARLELALRLTKGEPMTGWRLYDFASEVVDRLGALRAARRRFPGDLGEIADILIAAVKAEPPDAAIASPSLYNAASYFRHVLMRDGMDGECDEDWEEFYCAIGTGIDYENLKREHFGLPKAVAGEDFVEVLEYVTKVDPARPTPRRGFWASLFGA